MVGRSATFVDQRVVHAAIEGRVLILEGIEKAERNVLPVLNNLLENREMALEDGRFLMAADRYDSIGAAGRHGFERVSPLFVVIAIGVPSPPFRGHPLDPPLRSRFQCRKIDLLCNQSIHVALSHMMPLSFGATSQNECLAVAETTLQQIIRFVQQLRDIGAQTADKAGIEFQGIAFQKIPYVNEYAVLLAAHTLRAFPWVSLSQLLLSSYPIDAAVTDTTTKELLMRFISQFMQSTIPSRLDTSSPTYHVHSLEREHTTRMPFTRASLNECAAMDTVFTARLCFQLQHRDNQHQLGSTCQQHRCICYCGPLAPNTRLLQEVIASSNIDDGHNDESDARVQRHMLMAHCSGSDICVIGATGQVLVQGKSYYIRSFASILGYAPVQVLFIHAEMSDRHLLQMRSTDSSGSSLWVDSPLITSMRRGRLLVLDGIDRLPEGVVNALCRILQDREVSLFDGSQLLRIDRFLRLLRVEMERLRKQWKSCAIEDKGLVEDISEDRIEEMTAFLQQYMPPLGAKETSTINFSCPLDAQSYRLLCAAYRSLRQRGIDYTHPSFRVVAAATPPTQQKPWLNAELLHMFSFVQVDLSPFATSLLYGKETPTNTVLFLKKKLHRIIARFPVYHEVKANALDVIDRVVSFSFRLQSAFMIDDDTQANKADERLSIRQLIHICRHLMLFPHRRDALRIVSDALMLRFLPEDKRVPLTSVMEEWISENYADKPIDPAALKITFTHNTTTQNGKSKQQKYCTIGEVSLPVSIPKEHALVPAPLFFDIPMHVQYLENMMKDFVLQYPILLVGNQGVGKNKLADRLLQLLQREREYIQLHRDTTVQSLCLTPSMEDGVITWKDSPLVKSMKYGRVLMIDELDKAPTEVVCVLKSLLEDREILLADGRLFVSRSSPLSNPQQLKVIAPYLSVQETANIHLIHDDFKIIGLANRPGYPFLGNDLFREMGDVFSCHVIDNPDLDSEMALVASYGPNVNRELLRRLALSFADLRRMSDEGLLGYPYSTRELVATVNHLQRFPSEGIQSVLRNIFDFDGYDEDVQKIVFEVFSKHRIPFGTMVEGQSRVSFASSSALPPPIPYGTVLLRDSVPLEEIIQRQRIERIGEKMECHAEGSMLVRRINPTHSSLLFHFRLDRMGEIVAVSRFPPLFPETKREGREGIVAILLRNPWEVRVFDILSNGKCLDDTEMSTSINISLHHILAIRRSISSTADMHSIRVSLSTSFSGNNMNPTIALVISPSPVSFALIRLTMDGPILSPSYSISVYDLTKPLSSCSFAGSMANDDDWRFTVTPSPWNGRWNLFQRNGKGFASLFMPPTTGVPVEISLYAFPMSWRFSSVHSVSSRFLMGCDTLSQKMALLDTAGHAVKGVDLFHHHDDIRETKGISTTKEIVVPYHFSSVNINFGDLSKEQDISSSKGFIALCSQSSPDLDVTAFVTPVNNRHAPASYNVSAVVDRQLDTPFHLDVPQREGKSRFQQKSFYGRAVRRLTGHTSADGRITVIGSSVQDQASIDVVHHSLVGIVDDEMGMGGREIDIFAEKERIRVQSKTRRMEEMELNAENDASANESMESVSPIVNVTVVAVNDVAGQDHSYRVLTVQDNGCCSVFAINSPEDHIEDNNTDKGIEVDDLEEMGQFSDERQDRDRKEQVERTVDVVAEIHEAEENSGGEVVEGSVSRNGQDEREDVASSGPSAGEGIGAGGEGGEGGGEGGGGGSGKGSIGGRSGRGSLMKDSNFNLSQTDLEVQRREWEQRQRLIEKSTENVDSKMNVDSLARLSKTRAESLKAIERALQEARRAQEYDAKPDRSLCPNLVERRSYDRLYCAVGNEINQLRRVLESALGREGERVWLRGQNYGDLDDTRLVDSAAGDHNVFKRRGPPQPFAGMPPRLPKRLCFLMDVSSSMAQFNSSDRRLDRMIATAVMLMEGLVGFEHKFDYTIVGQNGSSSYIRFVGWGMPPNTVDQRIMVTQALINAAVGSVSGDHTLSAALQGINDVASDEGDDYFLFVISDANLRRYGITSHSLKAIITHNPKVHVIFIFIADKEVAQSYTNELPSSRAMVCLDTGRLPTLFRRVFASSITDQSKL